MEFKVETPETPVHTPLEDRQAASAIAQKLTKRYDALVKAVIIGRKAEGHSADHVTTDLHPLYVLLDDVSHHITKENVQEYVDYVTSLLKQHGKQFTVHNLKLSKYWDNARKMPQHHLELLRNGVAVYDTGFFGPFQALLFNGRIRPSYESMGILFGRGQQTLKNSRSHLLQAVLDLYWAVIDAAHAGLMHHGILPPSPAHVSLEMKRVLVKHGKLELKHVETMKKFYELSKQITHEEKTSITGKEYDALLKEAKAFILRMKKVITSRA